MSKSNTEVDSFWARLLSGLSRHVDRSEKESVAIVIAFSIGFSLTSLVLIGFFPPTSGVIAASSIFAILGVVSSMAAVLEGAFNYWCERKPRWMSQMRGGIAGLLLGLFAIYLNCTHAWDLWHA